MSGFWFFKEKKSKHQNIDEVQNQGDEEGRQRESGTQVVFVFLVIVFTQDHDADCCNGDCKQREETCITILNYFRKFIQFRYNL